MAQLNTQKASTASMAISLPSTNFRLLERFPCSPSLKIGVMRKPLLCSAIPQEQATEGMIMCDSCNGMGWLMCDFCQAKKVNVKSESNRIYRRCPSCRAVGYILCTKCKVFKCVTFPDVADGDSLVS